MPKSQEITLEELGEKFAFNDFTFDAEPLEEESNPPREDQEVTFEVENLGEPIEEDKKDDELVLETPPKKEEQEVSTLEVVETDFAKLAKLLISKGEWDDIEFQEEGTTLSKKKDLTEEEFNAVLEEQRNFKKEDTLEKYIPVDKVSEDKKTIVDIIINGGDLKEIFKDPNNMVKPFSAELGWDLENEDHLKNIVYQTYLAQGLSEKRAKLLLDADIEELTFDTKAKEIVEKAQTQYDNNLKKIASDLAEQRKAEAEELKTYKSSLVKSYKDLGLPETQIKKFVELATRQNQDGTFPVDEIYETAMKNPEDAKELIFFLTDKEGYLKKKMESVKNETQVNIAKKMARIPKDREKAIGKETAEKSNNEGFAFEMLKP
jgi:ferritin-like protein